MNLKFMRRVSERERAIRQFVIVKNKLISVFLCVCPPCIRLARGKFELTNQDSAGGKKSCVLTSSKQVRKGLEIRQLFSLEMALNIHEEGFTSS